MIKKVIDFVSARDTRIFVVIFSLTFCSRLPFIIDDYGLDGDGWRVINAARTIASTHHYIASRFPGYPFVELLLAALSAPSAIITNLITACFSGIAAAFFTLFIKKYSSEYFWAALAFAGTPIVFLNSIVTMDYVWAIGSICAVLYFFFSKRMFLLSGILLGLAIGCRISSLLFILPLILILIHQKEYRAFFFFVLPAGIVLLALFLPVIQTYGFSFLSMPSGTFSITQIAKKLTVDLWGIAGCIFFGIALIQSLRRKIFESLPNHQRFDIMVLIFGGIVLYLTLFFRLPVDAGYLIPIVPLFITYFAIQLTLRQFRIFSIGVICSSFIFSISPVDRPWHAQPSKISYSTQISGRIVCIDVLQGPLIKEMMQLKKQEEYLQHVNQAIDTIPYQAAFFVGDFIPKLSVKRNLPLREPRAEDIYIFEKYIIASYGDRNRLKETKRGGYVFFHLPGVEKINLEMNGVDLTKFGSQELNVHVPD
ncbi:MAG: hypothetical protein PHP42_10670 [Bacteroidota bacterium]|nr:hypothetical protein [Bacteroidota bacterium]